MTAARRQVLLDECLPHDLRHEIKNHDVATAAYAGVAGLSNGRLFKAIEGRYEIFVTIDGNIPHQQTLAGRNIAVVVLRASRNRIEALLPLVPALCEVLDTIHPGQIEFV
jgi:hypothetical protein